MCYLRTVNHLIDHLCLVSSVTFPFIRNRISVFRFENA